MTWDNVTIPMSSIDTETPTFFNLDSEEMSEVMLDRISDILAAKYAPADLNQVFKE